MSNGVPFNRQTLVEALHELGRLAFAEGKTIEISVYGGSALVLTFDWRKPTRDVDAVFEADKAAIRRFGARVADARGWDRDWLNDGVKGFLSARDGDPASKSLFGTFPSEEEPGVRIMIAAPEYLFAMKCRAMRIGGVEASPDIDDIRRLAAELGLSDVGRALDLISRFYPNQILEPKTQFGLEEILQKLPQQER